RNGVKLGVVQRDFQYLIKDCPPTHPPSVGLNASNNGNSGSGSTNWGTSTPDTIIVKLNKDTCYTIFVTDSSSSFYGSNKQENISYGLTNLPTSVLAFTPTYLELTPAMDTSTMQMCFSTCDKVLITKDSIYYLDIIVKNGSATDCPRRTDILRTYVHVIVDQNNTPPKLSTSLSPGNYILTHPDSLVKFYVYGTDADPNDINLITATGYHFRLSEYRMNYTKVYQGLDSLAYLFTWTPNCQDIQSGLQYKINFALQDESCIYTHHDTTSVTIRLQDVDTGLENIKPTNLITPNGDGLNDCFYLSNLPADNCTVFFKSVEIYNRWGARVFSSSDRNFKWCAGDVSDGIYYYSIDLSTKHLKEWIQVLR
ncbi:MAG TPA: gliding motility-associated C-terminal domain-containing protein, partial [Cytophagaceae bacterium]|nr:gliding motility-associated C-terminal domain-containing protein [Cytophagaceae bacterium]